MRGMMLGLTMVLASAGVSDAAVMTFDNVSGNYTDFDQTLGDIANLDVSNVTRTGFGNSAIAVGNIDHWGADYSELQDIAFSAQNGGVAELSFAPSAGSEVLLSSFDFGNYFQGLPTRNVTFRIYDISWNLVWELVVTGHTGSSVHVSPNIVLSDGGHFQWGNDWNVGIDNLAYSVRPDSQVGPSPVPLPAGLPLLVSGLGALGAIGWRRKQKAAA